MIAELCAGGSPGGRREPLLSSGDNLTGRIAQAVYEVGKKAYL